MLRFTKAQQEWVLNHRRQHERQHAIMREQNGGSVLVGNASPLPRDVWGEWDEEGIEIQRDILAVFNDLAASVTQSMPIGKLVHFFRQESDSGNINISLDGRSKAKTDQPLIQYQGTPLPIIDSTFSYGWRQVEAAQTEGMPLDPVARNNAQRRVAEKLESIVLDGDSDIKVGSDELFGLRTHPQRNTRTTGTALASATGAQLRDEFVACLTALHADDFRAPVTFYVNWDDWFIWSTTPYNEDHPGWGTSLSHIQQIPMVQEIIPSSSVLASEMIGVVKRRDVVQVLNGMPMNTRAEFRANPEDDYNFVTMAAAALEVRFTFNEQCGIIHSTI